MADNTQFNCLSKPPNSIERVLREIKRNPSVKRAGFLQKTDIRSVALSADQRYYDQQGRVMGLQQFLIDTTVLLRDAGQKFYFDHNQADTVLKSCKEKRQPKITLDVAKRLEVLKLRKSHPTQPVVQVVGALPTGESFPLFVSRFVDSLSEKAVVALKRVLYLLPIEYDLWETLCLRVRETENKECRVTIPVDPFAFYDECAAPDVRTKCTPQEYADTIARFIDAKLIKELDVSSKEERTFLVLVDWEEFHYIKIEKRGTLIVEPIWMDVIKLLVHANGIVEDQSRGMTARVSKMTHDHFPSLSEDNIRTRVFRKPHEIHCGMSLILKHEESGRRLLCWPGFELLNFQTKEEVLVSQTVMKSITVKPIPPQEKVMEPKNGIPETVVSLKTVDCHPMQAKVVLDVFRGTLVGSLASATTAYSFFKNLMKHRMLIKSGAKRNAKWSIDQKVAQTFRFTPKFSTQNLSKIVLVSGSEESRRVPVDQWLKDLEKIVADDTARKVSVPLLRQVLDSTPRFTVSVSPQHQLLRDELDKNDHSAKPPVGSENDLVTKVEVPAVSVALPAVSEVPAADAETKKPLSEMTEDELATSLAHSQAQLQQMEVAFNLETEMCKALIAELATRKQKRREALEQRLNSLREEESRVAAEIANL